MKYFILIFFLSFSAGAEELSSSEDPVRVRIEKGMSFNQTARLLKSRGLIQNVFYFKLLAWWKGSADKIKSGEYAFKKSLSSGEILSRLLEGKVYLHSVTFPEGYNLYEMAELLQKKN